MIESMIESMIEMVAEAESMCGEFTPGVSTRTLPNFTVIRCSVYPELQAYGWRIRWETFVPRYCSQDMIEDLFLESQCL